MFWFFLVGEELQYFLVQYPQWEMSTGPVGHPSIENCPLISWNLFESNSYFHTINPCLLNYLCYICIRDVLWIKKFRFIKSSSPMARELSPSTFLLFLTARCVFPRTDTLSLLHQGIRNGPSCIDYMQPFHNTLWILGREWKVMGFFDGMFFVRFGCVCSF